MKPNTVIKLPDGKIGTVVYSHLDGEGIIYGEHQFNNYDDLPEPEAMLRNQYPGASYPCIGGSYEVIKPGFWPEEGEPS